MAYQHPTLAYALGWKFNHQAGICTSMGSLTAWPTQPWPTDAEQATWVGEYETYLASAQCQDDEWQAFLDSKAGKAVKAMALVLIDKGVCTAAELKAKYRSL